MYHIIFRRHSGHFMKGVVIRFAMKKNSFSNDKKDWWPELKKQMAALLKLCLHFGLVINLCEISFKC